MANHFTLKSYRAGFKWLLLGPPRPRYSHVSSQSNKEIPLPLTMNSLHFYSYLTRLCEPIHALLTLHREEWRMPPPGGTLKAGH